MKASEIRTMLIQLAESCIDANEMDAKRCIARAAREDEINCRITCGEGAKREDKCNEYCPNLNLVTANACLNLNDKIRAYLEKLLSMPDDFLEQHESELPKCLWDWKKKEIC